MASRPFVTRSTLRSEVPDRGKKAAYCSIAIGNEHVQHAGIIKARGTDQGKPRRPAISQAGSDPGRSRFVEIVPSINVAMMPKRCAIPKRIAASHFASAQRLRSGFCRSLAAAMVGRFRESSRSVPAPVRRNTGYYRKFNRRKELRVEIHQRIQRRAAVPSIISADLDHVPSAQPAFHRSMVVGRTAAPCPRAE